MYQNQQQLIDFNNLYKLLDNDIETLKQKVLDIEDRLREAEMRDMRLKESRQGTGQFNGVTSPFESTGTIAGKNRVMGMRRASAGDANTIEGNSLHGKGSLNSLYGLGSVRVSSKGGGTIDN